MMLEYAFFRNALLCILLISISAAIIGTYIVTRRLVSIAGGITHACFGGLGLGAFLGVSPIAMAGLVAAASSLGVEWMSRRDSMRSDSAVAVIWSIGMALGVLFVFLTPGYVPELTTFLFGNILTVSRADLWACGIYTLLLVGWIALFHRQVIAVAFDPDFARVMGLRVTFFSTAMTVFTAIGIVLTIRLVGVMLLMSMLSLPQMIAERFTCRVAPMAIVSVGVTLMGCLGGLMLSSVIDVPCSALIVLLLAAAWLLTLPFRRR